MWKNIKKTKTFPNRKDLVNLFIVWMRAIPLICRLCVRVCMCVSTCVTSSRAIMLDTGMTMITVCHALTHGDEGPGGCSLCHDRPRTRPVTPLTPQTPATPPAPRLSAYIPTPSCSHVQLLCIDQTQNLITFSKSIHCHTSILQTLNKRQMYTINALIGLPFF